MSNTLLTVDEITAEALRVLHNELRFVRTIDKQHDKTTTIAGQKRGASLRIRKPIQPTVRSTWTLDVQDVTEEYDTLTVGTIRGVDLNFTDADLAQSLTDFSRQIIQPAVKRLATEVDKVTIDAATKDIYNLVGTAGTTPATALVWLQAVAKLQDFATPAESLVALLNPAAQAATVNGLSSLFHAASKIEEQYKKGKMGVDALGISEWYTTQNITAITAGTRTNSTPLIDGTRSTEGGTTIHIDGFASSVATIAEGDVFTVSGVYAVNPESKATMASLQQFVVTAAATCASSETDVTVSPAIYTSASGGLQTVSAFPQDGATVTFTGSASTAYPQNLVYHPEFCTFATASLEMPSDVNFKAQMEVDGINIRILRQYDINNATFPCRMDVYFGSLVQRASMACRVIG